MVLFLGLDFTENRPVKSALESFFGIGPSVAQRLMARYHLHPMSRVGDLGRKQVQDLTAGLSGMCIENELRRKLTENIQRLRAMGTYRGRRHHFGLPVRGQRTRSQIITARKLNRLARRW
ncbi:MAG: hypothetical protein M1826_003529 [Phylliscum demangeonii]|nr:MAG: hypothetical protein M1826_003529 [Phylliscum demangeonii]